jgi:hypothetical protein
VVYRYLLLTFALAACGDSSARPDAGAPPIDAQPDAQPSVPNRGRVVVGGGSWLDGANFPETPLSVSKIVFGPEHHFGARKGSPPKIVFGPEYHFGARKGSPPPHPRSAKPFWKPPTACPRP